MIIANDERGILEPYVTLVLHPLILRTYYDKI